MARIGPGAALGLAPAALGGAELALLPLVNDPFVELWLGVIGACGACGVRCGAIGSGGLCMFDGSIFWRGLLFMIGVEF